jgi:hypothetical protein
MLPPSPRSARRRIGRERNADRPLQRVRRSHPGDDSRKREEDRDEQASARNDDFSGASGVGEFGFLLRPEGPADIPVETG